MSTSPPARKRARTGVYDLFALMETADMDRFAELVQAVGADVNRLHRRTTLLMWAVGRNLEGAARVLLEHGANPNMACSHGDTCLQTSILRGYTSMTTLLLQHGASPDTINSRMETALSIATRMGDLETTKLLVSHGASVAALTTHPMGNPLWRAAATGELEIARFLLEQGADVEYRGSDMSTPVHFAMQRGDVPMVRLLAEHGADLNSIRGEGTSPLAGAVCNRVPVDAIAEFLRLGADPNARDEAGAYPLIYAAEKNDIEAARVLLEHGARDLPFGPSRLGCIDKALHKRNAEILEWFLQQDAFAGVRPAAEILEWAPPQLQTILCAYNRLCGREHDVFRCAVEADSPAAVWRVRREGLPVHPDVPVTGASLAARLVRLAVQPWSPATHPLYSRERRRVVLAILCSFRRLCYCLPVDTVFHMCAFVPDL